MATDTSDNDRHQCTAAILATKHMTPRDPLEGTYGAIAGLYPQVDPNRVAIAERDERQRFRPGTFMLNLLNPNKLY